MPKNRKIILTMQDVIWYVEGLIEGGIGKGAAVIKAIDIYKLNVDDTQFLIDYVKGL